MAVRDVKTGLKFYVNSSLMTPLVAESIDLESTGFNYADFLAE